MIGKILFDSRACKADRSTFWRVVAARPLIVYLQGSVKHMVYLHRHFAGRQAYFLRGAIGCEEHPRYARRWSSYQLAARRYYPEHRVMLLTNTPSAADGLARRGADVRFCSQNGLLDERLFVVHRDVAKQFDAVINSQMEAVKRHELAAQVESLAVIAYRLDSQPRYYRRIRELLTHASWLNFKGDAYSFIPSEEMSSQLSRARVGLILSAAEGANYAMVEYLLSGIPVVSTRCQGGREVFFDDRCVKVVDDDPRAVAEGVREMVARRLDPEFVRECVLEKLLVHRATLLSILQGFSDDAGVDRDLRAEWGSWFVNKLLSWKPLTALDAEVRAAELRDESIVHSASPQRG
jgi:hypothetical protein